jgi:hypothetical protein
MKHFLLFFVMLALTSCAHRVLVRKDSCSDVAVIFAECTEVD